MAATRAVANPSTLKPETILLIIIKSKALITKVNNPNVRIFIGKVNKVIIGLINKVNTPHTMADTINVCQPLMTTPGTI